MFLHFSKCFYQDELVQQLSPTIPLRSGAERKALLDAIQGLGVVNDIMQLIPPKIVASNVTSQFRLLVVLDAGFIEIHRSGWGWGRDLTVAAVVFTDKTDFSSFLELGSFSSIKEYLAESVLQQREVIYHGDSQVPVLSPSDSTTAVVHDTGI